MKFWLMVLVCSSKSFLWRSPGNKLNIFPTSKPKYPNIPGLKDFGGKIMHSGAWDGEYDLAGKTVAVIGGGSSAVQIIPNIQPGIYDHHSSGSDGRSHKQW